MRKFGWLPELADPRDYDIDLHPTMASGLRPAFPPSLPDHVDLTKHCSPIEDQGRLGSCTAQAVIGCAEYYQRQRSGRHTDASRLFLYWTSRHLHGWTGDTGCYVRSAMKAMSVFGAPPERYWPYNPAELDTEPGPFSFAYAQRFRVTAYYRLDRVSRTRPQLLDTIRRVISYGIPVVFGFVVFSYGSSDGTFPMPEPGDRALGGHAVVAVGYDDAIGALRVRNSWGTRWGEDGYGWLPYGYVLEGLSSDFWAIYHQQYRTD